MEADLAVVGVVEVDVVEINVVMIDVMKVGVVEKMWWRRWMKIT